MSISNRIILKVLAPATLVVVLSMFAFDPASHAAVTAFKAVQVDNSSAGPALSSYVTNDIFIDFTGRWEAAAALMGPFASNAIFQHPDGNDDGGPIIGLPPIISPPGLMADTSTNTTPISCATPLHACSTKKFSDREIDAAWGSPLGQDISDKSDFGIMRLTLHNSLNASALFWASADNAGTTIAARIENGVVTFVPEPASGVMAAAALALGLVRRRRATSRGPC